MEKSKGFIIVASKKRNFYSYAINLAESLRDYYEPEEECKICLVTEEQFIDDRGRDVADDIIICDDHYRAKLWGWQNLRMI